MNLAWIAAVLEPHAVAIHPNFNDEEYSQEPVGQLAALLIGGDWARSVTPNDIAVSYTEALLRPETVSEGAEGLIQEAFSGHGEDMARSVALSLLASFAAAEMEEYDKCDAFLTRMINMTDSTASGKLARAALTQQRALRRRDAGSEYIQDVFDAANLLEGLVPAQFPPFIVGPGSNSTPESVIESIIYTLKRSAWSLTPREYDAERPFDSFPSRMNRLKMPLSERILRISADRASVYSRYVRDGFTEHFTNSTIIGRSTPDLFHQTLALELLGHGDVYRARRDLATLRLVQYAEGADVSNLHVSIRLLRQAGATKELNSALERIRAAGPISALSRDARQIILRRSTPQRLRVPELSVLKAAAELMAPSEANKALEAVLASLAAGGPPNVAGASQHRIARLGAAWQAASTLASSCRRGDEVAALLLREAQDGRHHTQLLDSNVARSVRTLSWEEVGSPIKAQWSDWLTSDGARNYKDTAEAVTIALELAITRTGELSGIDSIAARLNIGLHNAAARLTDTEVGEVVSHVNASLNETRDESARGLFSFGTRSVGDIAALLIIEYPNAYDLWESLSSFLTSDAVPRIDRTPAFDRLARELPALPSATRELFRSTVDRLLESPGGSIFYDDPITPYPAALRFVAAYSLVDDARVMESLARLSGHTDLQARREASRTLSYLRVRASEPWILPFALQMSHESDISIKSNAARFLAHVATDTGPFTSVASARLVELLGKEDGLLVPLFALRELAGKSQLTNDVAQAIESLCHEHPSRQVRAAASRVIAGLNS
ncbi:hypothetical protein G3I20_30895 [Streptomyces sp. SID8111]|uniref:hypothetical protein n=1 Tax=Streptomyces sp. SID8111 TaxID=2706100 RepID=UPI0013BF2286|nr:hypothetical protein [Streptomyces sp. SID8111]NEC30887.1 hypothetical protein [Streptomyces sp. SID8111]